MEESLRKPATVVKSKNIWIAWLGEAVLRPGADKSNWLQQAAILAAAFWEM